MKKTKIFDVIIVGAGPAGLMAARELAEHDINYGIIEAQHTIGYPLKCAEITREETFNELFDHSDYAFIKNRVSQFTFQIKNTRKCMKKNLLVLDKPKFQQWLAEPIEENLMLNTKLLALKKKNHFLEISTNRGAFQSKLVILANGTQYGIQERFGLITKTVERVPCIGGFFNNDTLSPDNAYFFFDEDLFIASWCFPKGKQIFNAGAGIMLKNSRTKGLNLVKAFKQSMQQFGISLQGKISFGGTYVTNGPIRRTYSDRLLICGDAAGQTFAGVGEGIYFSLKAGQLAGKVAIQAINNNNFQRGYLKNYEMAWKKSFGKQLNAGIIFTTVLFFLMKKNLAQSALKMIRSKDIYDIWVTGHVFLPIKLIYIILKMFGCSPKR
jgi:digeranylgeranylglycerophospholipid reductase